MELEHDGLGSCRKPVEIFYKTGLSPSQDQEELPQNEEEPQEPHKLSLLVLSFASNLQLASSPKSL